jgi:NADH-quinone oxidoreductase subunit J
MIDNRKSERPPFTDHRSPFTVHRPPFTDHRSPFTDHRSPIMQLFLFFVLAAAAIAGALGVVLSKKPVYSALALLLNFVVLAALFITLHAQFLAVVQIIVYAGAIVVLFLFVIMLIGGDLPGLALQTRGRVVAAGVAAVAGVLALAGLVYVVVAGSPAAVSGAVPGSGSVQAIGEALFTTYLLPFELASVLLLVAMIGAVALARKAGNRHS